MNNSTTPHAWVTWKNFVWQISGYHLLRPLAWDITINQYNDSMWKKIDSFLFKSILANYRFIFYKTIDTECKDDILKSTNRSKNRNRGGSNVDRWKQRLFRKVSVDNIFLSNISYRTPYIYFAIYYSHSGPRSCNLKVL